MKLLITAGAAFAQQFYKQLCYHVNTYIRETDDEIIAQTGCIMYNQPVVQTAVPAGLYNRFQRVHVAL
jgi:hypothetical protein